MRKLLGRTAAITALAILLLASVPGPASAAGSARQGRPSAMADECYRHHGVWYCADGWDWYPDRHSAGPGI
ncbi:hypothetical protein BGM09_24865 [Streptomyces sp. CBMA29]|nr:hypothetical protein [Streptomyces sp. CBMA29]